MSEALRRNASRGLALVGLALFAFLVWRFGWRTLLDHISSARADMLAAMLGLTLLGFWLRAWKWRIAMGPDADAVRMFFLAKVLGSWTPGRVGELSPLLLREHRSLRMGAWIVADRIIEIWLTLAFGLAGLWAVSAVDPVLASALAALFAAGTIAMWWLARAESPPASDGAGWLARAWRLLHALRGEARHWGSKAAPIVLLTLTAKAADIIAVMCLCRAFGYAAGFLLVAAARCAHALVSALPLTPDATGVPYLAQAALLHREAGMPLDVLTAALALEALLIYGALHLSAAAALWRAPRNKDSK